MVNRHYVLALLFALVGVMSLISCSTTDTVTSNVSASETSVPRIVTVLQAED